MQKLCKACQKSEVAHLSWWERLRLGVYKFFYEEILDLSSDKYTEGFGEGYKQGFKAAKERFSESRSLLLAFDEVRDSFQRGLNTPSLYDPSDVLSFVPGPDGKGVVKIGGQEVDKQTLADLKIESDKIRRTRLWPLMVTKIRSLAVTQALNRSKNWEEVLMGKAALDNINLQESMLKAIEEAK